MRVKYFILALLAFCLFGCRGCSSQDIKAGGDLIAAFGEAQLIFLILPLGFLICLLLFGGWYSSLPGQKDKPIVLIAFGGAYLFLGIVAQVSSGAFGDPRMDLITGMWRLGIADLFMAGIIEILYARFIWDMCRNPIG